MRRYLACVCAAAALIGAREATAAPITATVTDYFTFSLDGVPGTGTTMLLANPTPSSYILNTSFTLSSVSVAYMGTTYTGPVTFYDAGGAGGQGVNIGGDPLYFGPDNTPSFKLGVFNLNGLVDLGSGTVPVTGSVTITQAPIVVPPPTSPVPEPATLGLVGTGALGLIGAVRRRVARSNSGTC